MRDSEIAVNDPVDMSRVQRLPERGVRDSRAAARRVHQPRSTQGSPRQVSFFFDACCSCLSLLNSSRSGMGNGGIQETTIKMCVCVCVYKYSCEYCTKWLHYYRPLVFPQPVLATIRHITQLDWLAHIPRNKLQGG